MEQTFCLYHRFLFLLQKEFDQMPHPQQGITPPQVTPQVALQMEQAINRRSNPNGTPISPEQQERIQDVVCGTTQVLETNNEVLVILNAHKQQALYESYHKTSWWKRSLQVIGVVAAVGFGALLHKLFSKPGDTNSVPME